MKYITYLTEDSFIVETETNNTNKFIDDKYQALYDHAFIIEKNEYDTTLNYLINASKYLISLISNHSLIELNRDNIIIELNDDDYFNLTNDMPFIVNEKFLTMNYFEILLEELLKIFKKEITKVDTSVLDYFKSKDANLNVASRIYFHLVENDDIEYPFAFLATYSKQKNKKIIHTPLEKALIEFKDDQNALVNLLSAVTKVANESKFISELIKTGELFQPIYITINEASIILKESIMYEKYGIMCRIPKWYKNKTNKPKISLNLEKKESISIASLIQYKPSILIDDEIITVEELLGLLNNKNDLVNYKGKWVNIDENNINLLLSALDTLNDRDDITFFELLKLEYNPNLYLDINDQVDIGITQNKWLIDFKKQLTRPIIIEDIPLSNNLRAKLRPYQQTGYNWLMTMLNYGLGALLADDMGLGKTLQVISVLTSLYDKNKYKTLLVVPSSLMLNWVKEFEKFSNIKPIIIHNQVGTKLIDFKLENKVYITTYQMAKKLIEYEFDLLIIDEAQAIKNQASMQSKIIKDIKAKHRIALSGTPIENNLMELFSLFDFLNKGLLGTSKEYKAQANDIVKNESYGRLRKLIKPFILRRVKTDKNIISDLPSKIEVNEYVSLSKTQIKLYNAEVEMLKRELEKEEVPKGLILKYILKFKQICNHPSIYLKDNKYDYKDSGKFDSLNQIATVVSDNQERMLVFTQFKEMCEPLNEYLKTVFNKEGLVLTGDTSIKKRNEMVNIFNSSEYIPYMILSLKAGGTGLNLTKANHVVHFDRWWNPAVENQASDRAYRIGQNKNVNVYKFVCSETIEEKIDNIINSKQDLANNILKADGEAWISKMSKNELISLFEYKGGK